MKGKVSVLLTALLFALLFCVSASAQTINGNIVGTITDEQGAAVPGVTVTATNKATGFSRSNVSNDEGNYRISALPSGDYAVTTDKSGFGAANISVDVNVSADSRTDIVLKAGQVQQILDILDRRPVQQWLWIFQPEPLGEAQQRLPEPTVPMNNEPCASVTNVAQPFKYQANVIEIPDKIRQDNEVEWLSWEFQVLGGHLAKV